MIKFRKTYYIYWFCISGAFNVPWVF